MKNALLGILLLFGASVFGQNLTSAAPLKKVIRTVNTFEKPLKVKKVAKTEKNKTYAYLTRIVSTISEEEYKKRQEVHYQ